MIGNLSILKLELSISKEEWWAPEGDSTEMFGTPSFLRNYYI